MNIKFTIGTATNNFEFAEDLKLIKSSVLYADEIELIGMAEYAVFQYLPKHINNAKDIRSMYQCVAPFLRAVDSEEAKNVVLQFENLLNELDVLLPFFNKNKRRSRQEIIAQQRMNKVQEEFKRLLENEISSMIKTSGANEIQRLYQNGIVKICDYGYDDFDTEEIIGSYFGNLLKTVNSEATFPLFDKICSDVASIVMKDKVIDVSNIKQEVLRHAGIATNILMTLPTLESAKIDELLDLKKELNQPLVNFRKAMFEFSEQIETLPWDKDFQFDCMKLYYTKVLPQIEELNNLASETSVLKNLGNKVLADESVRRELGFVAGGLATTITTSTNMEGILGTLESLIHQSAGIGISAAVAMSFLKGANMYTDAKKECDEVKQKMENNVMYFYYKLQKRL